MYGWRPYALPLTTGHTRHNWSHNATQQTNSQQIVPDTRYMSASQQGSQRQIFLCVCVQCRANILDDKSLCGLARCRVTKHYQSWWGGDGGQGGGGSGGQRDGDVTDSRARGRLGGWGEQPLVLETNASVKLPKIATDLNLLHFLRKRDITRKKERKNESALGLSWGRTSVPSDVRTKTAIKVKNDI